MKVLDWFRGRSSGGGPKLPPPPAGFRWHRFAAPRVTVLRPDGWHVHEADAPGTFTGCVSVESIPERGSFTTGLTVQHHREVRERMGLPPSAVPVGYYRATESDLSNSILEAYQGAQGAVSTSLLRYRNAPAGAEPIVVHLFVVALDRTNELYLFSFEGTEARWDEAWALGEPILKNLVIDGLSL